MTLKKRLRHLWMGFATVTGLAPRGYFIPYRYAAGTKAAIAPYRPIDALFDSCTTRFQDVLDSMDRHADALTALGGDPPAPRWTQQWFARLDGAAAYVMVRDRRPARIIEIGSGHSTRFLARAAADGGFDTAITAIDPAPRADLAGLPVSFIKDTVQSAGLEAFTRLHAGDILMIDSSHIAMPGTDVDFLFGRVLPALPGGVLVHIHDICLPDDYPAAWRWRGYNEQQATAALLAGGGFRPLFASHYVASRMADRLAKSVAGRLPLAPGTPETSLWLEKTAAPIGPMV